MMQNIEMQWKLENNLEGDLQFLEAVAIRGAEKRKQDNNLLSEMQDKDAIGTGIKIDNPNRMACYEFALYGYGGNDIRKTTDFRDEDQTFGMGLKKLVKHLQNNNLGTAFSSLGKVSVRDVMKIGGHEMIQNRGKNGEEYYRRTPAVNPYNMQFNRKNNRIYIEHFVLRLPNGCYIETVNGRSVMCTAPGNHMESGMSQKNDDTEFVPITKITHDQLIIIDLLVAEAYRLNKEYNLGSKVPLNTAIYRALLEVKWIGKSELSIDVTKNEQLLVEAFTRLCEEMNSTLRAGQLLLRTNQIISSMQVVYANETDYINICNQLSALIEKSKKETITNMDAEIIQIVSSVLMKKPVRRPGWLKDSKAFQSSEKKENITGKKRKADVIQDKNKNEEEEKQDEKKRKIGDERPDEGGSSGALTF